MKPNLNRPCVWTERRYDPFGMITYGRTWQIGSDYRYGFNAQEQDDELYGNGELNTAEFWEYDTRLGRRWNIDPILFPWLSGYSVFENNPILLYDLNGLSSSKTDKRQAKEFAKATDGKMTKNAQGEWEVNISGTYYFEYKLQQAEAKSEFWKIDDKTGEILNAPVTIPSTYTFTDGKSYFDLLWKVGVDYWDAALAGETGFERFKTRISSIESWVHSDNGEAFGRTIANMNPGVSAINIGSGISSGNDIYGENMDGWDYLDQGLNTIPTYGAGEGISYALKATRTAAELLALAKKYGLNFHSATTKQLIENWDMKASEWVGKYRQGSVKTILGDTGEKTIGEIFSTADSTTRKMLIDGRFKK